MAVGAVAHEALADVDGGGLAGVSGVLLEGKPEDRELLARDGVEHASDYALDKAGLLVVVDLHDLRKGGGRGGGGMRGSSRVLLLDLSCSRFPSVPSESSSTSPILWHH